jgi:hypothetical protein
MLDLVIIEVEGVEDPKGLNDLEETAQCGPEGEVVPARLGHVLHSTPPARLGGPAHVMASGLIVRRHLPGHFAPKSPSYAHTITGSK